MVVLLGNCLTTLLNNESAISMSSLSNFSSFHPFGAVRSLLCVSSCATRLFTIPLGESRSCSREICWPQKKDSGMILEPSGPSECFGDWIESKTYTRRAQTKLKPDLRSGLTALPLITKQLDCSTLTKFANVGDLMMNRLRPCSSIGSLGPSL